jgi:KDO2-lipid IV(A) lauroyltransferase
MSLQYRLEYVALRTIWALICALPAKWAYPLGAALGDLWYLLDFSRRRIARTNLLRTGVAASPREARRVARASFRHFAGHVVESVRVQSVLTAENWRDHLEIEAPEESIKMLVASEPPVFLVTGHLGSWEVAGLWLSFFRPVYTIARPMNNPLVQKFIERQHLRSIHGMTFLPKNHAFTPEVIKAWSERRAAFAVLMDQHAGRSGIWMDVLGVPASVHTSPARLHFMSGHPLIVGAFVRVGPLRYRVIVSAPIRMAPTHDREQDTRKLMGELNQHLEALIRRYPEQYLWMHRRWRTPPAVVNSNQ